MSTATQNQLYIINQPLEVKNSILTPKTNYNYRIIHQCFHKVLINYNKRKKKNLCSTKLVIKNQKAMCRGKKKMMWEDIYQNATSALTTLWTHNYVLNNLISLIYYHCIERARN